MSARMQIKAQEHGVVRVFAIDLPEARDDAFAIEDLSAALGGVSLLPEHVDIIAIDDLDELGLDGYLIHGIGIGKSEVVQLRPQLRALKGHVALIRSAAFDRTAVTLAPKQPIRWVATFGEQPLDLTSKPLRSESAKGTLSPPVVAPPHSPHGAPIWMYAAFAFLAFLILTVFTG